MSREKWLNRLAEFMDDKAPEITTEELEIAAREEHLFTDEEFSKAISQWIRAVLRSGLRRLGKLDPNYEYINVIRKDADGNRVQLYVQPFLMGFEDIDYASAYWEKRIRYDIRQLAHVLAIAKSSKRLTRTEKKNLRDKYQLYLSFPEDISV